MKKLIFAAVAAVAGAAMADSLKVEIEPGEGWWGGATTFGREMPFGRESKVDFDIRKDNYSNQSVPFLASDKGRYIWCDNAFRVTVENGVIALEGEGDAKIELVRAGKTLKDAFLAAAKAHFPASGKTPDLDLIAKPQWNTWIELTYNQNEKDILAYAAAIKANGFPEGGVLMIDDTWQFGYGVWQFDPRRFSDPKGMVDKLHAMGFKVMLWVCPFVSMDCPGYRELAFGKLDAGVNVTPGGLLTRGVDSHGRRDPIACDWWNGKSAMLDFSDPIGSKWFARELKKLQTQYGVDGFKLDAGDTECFRPPYETKTPATPSQLCEGYARIGLEFPLNEYRACFKMGGQPLVQRLCDKGHRWSELQQLMPDLIACGLLGHPFVCPDMIGGGSWMAFMPDAPTPYDPELFVRSAQVHALAPMMQFSAAPWRMLKGEHLDAVRNAANLRMKFTPYLLAQAKASATSGEPILRAMEYEFPGNGFAAVKDQFVVGHDLIVAPQVQKGAKEREVLLPEGDWKGNDGTVVNGPAKVTVATPLARIPYFVRVGSGL